jgi:hypothetical protein
MKRKNFIDSRSIDRSIAAKELGFAFVPEFFAVTSLLENLEPYKKELKPFLTILGTHMRATVVILVWKTKKLILLPTVSLF